MKKIISLIISIILITLTITACGKMKDFTVDAENGVVFFSINSDLCASTIYTDLTENSYMYNFSDKDSTNECIVSYFSGDSESDIVYAINNLVLTNEDGYYSDGSFEGVKTNKSDISYYEIKAILKENTEINKSDASLYEVAYYIPFKKGNLVISFTGSKKQIIENYAEQTIKTIQLVETN